jgi:hypothetical protein
MVSRLVLRLVPLRLIRNRLLIDLVRINAIGTKHNINFVHPGLIRHSTRA